MRKSYIKYFYSHSNRMSDAYLLIFQVIAVKQMRRTGNSDENKRILMDLDVVLKSHDCKVTWS